MPLSKTLNSAVDPETILTTDGLTVGYGHVKKPKVILDRINVSLKKGQLVCLLGENGIGKSTLLKTLSKVLPPISGEVYINRIPIADINNKQLAHHVSLVLANYQRPAMLKAKEIVTLGRYPFTSWGGGLGQEDKDKIAWAMQLTNTHHLRDEAALTLSDGQMQKVMIARALAQDSDIMILDEPTAHLDINNRLELMNLLKCLAWETKKAILVSTHDLDSAFHTADQLWLATCCLPIVTGCPEELVLNGEIASLFDNGNFHFDYQHGRFRSFVQSTRTIQLIGEDKYYWWTKNGLERIGCQVVSTKGQGKINILKENNNKIYWELIMQGKAAKFKQIGLLLDFLRENQPL